VRARVEQIVAARGEPALSVAFADAFAAAPD
jgi:hypothetical protein